MKVVESVKNPAVKAGVADEAMAVQGDPEYPDLHKHEPSINSAFSSLQVHVLLSDDTEASDGHHEQSLEPSGAYLLVGQILQFRASLPAEGLE